MSITLSGQQLVYHGTKDEIETLTGLVPGTNLHATDTNEYGVFTDTFHWFGTGSVVPGGSDQSIQYHDGSALGGDANLTWDKTTRTLTLKGDPDDTNVATFQGVGASSTKDGGLVFNGGDSENNGDVPGAVVFNGGNGIGATGGIVAFNAGNSDTDIAGSVFLNGGTGFHSGEVSIIAGNSTGPYQGGDLNFYGGQAGDVGHGIGGSVGMVPGSGGAEGGEGGSVIFYQGNGTGGYPNGVIKFMAPGNGVSASLNTDGITDNRDIALPDKDGTLAMLDDVPASLADLSDDSTHRLVTDAEKGAWNGKADPSDIPTDIGDLTGDKMTWDPTWNNLFIKGTANSTGNIIGVLESGVSTGLGIAGGNTTDADLPGGDVLILGGHGGPGARGGNLQFIPGTPGSGGANGQIYFGDPSGYGVFLATSGLSTWPTLTIPNASGTVALTSQISGAGTSFPGGPSTGQRYFRTDLGYECYYDGTRWLTVQEYSTPIPDINFTIGTNYGALRSTNQSRSLYFTRASISVYVTTNNNGSNFWTITVYGWGPNYGSNQDLFTFNTGGDTADIQYNHNGSCSPNITASQFMFDLVAVSTGSPGLLSTFGVDLYYRLIIT